MQRASARRLALACLPFIFWAHFAAAQTCPTTASTPNFTAGGSVFGRIAAQWNAYFGAKADANNGVLCSPTIIGGSVTGAFSIQPGLANQRGTFNPGSQTIAAGSVLSPQLYNRTKSTGTYIVNSDLGGFSDSGAILTAIGSSVIFDLPTPSSATAGTVYHIGSNGLYGYTVNATSMYGCASVGTGSSSYGFPAIDVDFIDDGTNYKCREYGIDASVPYTWTGAQTFTTVNGTINTQVGTTYTLSPNDCGKTIKFTGSSPITLTTLATVVPGCSIAIEQAGAGQVTLANGSGATSDSAHSFTRTYGQWAILSLTVDANSGGSSAHYVITGDGA